MKHDAATERAIAIIRTCPECGKADEVYAFQKVSDPAQADDGSYAVCSDCHVHWQMDLTWVWPDLIVEDRGKAVRISTLIIAHSRRVDPSPEFKQLKAALQDKG
jgi:hypothetical protein